MAVHTIDTDAEIDNILLKEQASDPTSPGLGYGRLYAKDDGDIYYLNIRGVVSSLSFEGAVVKNSSTVNIGHETLTTVDWGVEDYDTNAFHDLSTNPSRLTVPDDGRYVVRAFTKWAIVGGTFRKMLLLLNGTEIARDERSAIGFGAGTLVSWPIVCSAGDYFELQVFQDSGATAALLSDSRFSISRVG